jgi:XTP/dITP diphosphohydrolase
MITPVELLFATSNINKTSEIRSALPQGFTLRSLSDLSRSFPDVDEPFESLEENAIHKARTYAEMTGMNCFSEDTGLEVFSLQGEPGVRSARYAGEPGDAQKNIQKLLSNLIQSSDRKAQFRTVIALIMNEDVYRFEGICKGSIIYEQKGQNGFGYDSVFIPDGSLYTFAEMNVEEKNRFSHRKKALGKMIEFLEERLSV